MNLPIEVRQRTAKTKKENETKLGQQAKEMIIVGFQETGYQLLDPKTMTQPAIICCYENENFSMVRDQICAKNDDTSNTIVVSDKLKPALKKKQMKKTKSSWSNTLEKNSF